MNTKWLKPADGLRVRFEGGGPMPDVGAEVPLTQYYRRRLRDGDLVEGEDPGVLDPVLIEAVKAVIERGEVTGEGAPKVSALEAEYGAPVTAELRDRAFAAATA